MNNYLYMYTSKIRLIEVGLEFLQCTNVTAGQVGQPKIETGGPNEKSGSHLTPDHQVFGTLPCLSSISQAECMYQYLGRSRKVRPYLISISQDECMDVGTKFDHI